MRYRSSHYFLADMLHRSIVMVILSNRDHKERQGAATAAAEVLQSAITGGHPSFVVVEFGTDGI